jgi:hypothetical protein
MAISKQYAADKGDNASERHYAAANHAVMKKNITGIRKGPERQAPGILLQPAYALLLWPRSREPKTVI